MTKSFEKELKSYLPLIEAIVELFHPFVEVAIHNLETGKIEKLYHNISKRKIGERSPLQELKVAIDQFPDYFAPYYKRNWDGRELKCTSVTLRDSQGKPIGLICINFDTHVFQNIQQQFLQFLAVRQEADNPI